ncbi:hypothetical protein, partial [Cysteiniphilum litorale]|uniref:hypothetical protein n=1 Tax=Cysteiniphilum litorale TaxID=2056700 RepID=UPI003F8817FE
MISYPELPTFRTAGFTKWFMECFSTYRGLSKKELNVKQSSGKGLGRSDGVRREEVLAFLSGGKHKIGYLRDEDIVGPGAGQGVPGEVLSQLEEEEADFVAWMQAERVRPSMGSTGRSGPSSEDSGERPILDSGAGSSGKPTRRSKRKRGLYRQKPQCENSPDVEIPLTMDAKASGDAGEPPEKR